MTTSRLIDEWGHFTAMPEIIIEAWPKLGTDAVATFLYLRYRTNRERGHPLEGCAWPSLKLFEENTGMGRKRILAALKVLEAFGLLERKKRYSASVVYRLARPPDLACLSSIIATPLQAPQSSPVVSPGSSTSGVETPDLDRGNLDSSKYPIEGKDQEHSRVGLSKAEQDAVRKTVEDHFKALTSLTVPPSKKEAGELWWAPLREVCSLVEWVPGVGIELLTVCVQRAKQNRTEVASPKSIIKYARAIRAAQLRGEPIGALGGNGRPGNARQGYNAAADMAAFKNKRGLK